MSLWFRRKDAEGRRYYYSVSVPWFWIITVVVLLAFMAIHFLLGLFR
jgi:hypothetical protein